MIGSLATNILLICLLAITNWDRILGLCTRLYLIGSLWVTTPAVLALYGVVLIYLLFAVHALSIRDSTPKRRRSRLVPYYDSEGQLQGWVREAQNGSDTNGAVFANFGDVGRAMMHLLAIQHELEEPFNLNGDLFEDIVEEDIIRWRSRQLQGAGPMGWRR
ncbi:hypothetical protein K438DRAFT_1779743 [Mycena galopus ATCC 62051]|nr:hypothetical protein K438DRAFT_1779743 [Mycena galopus ATCC 62051]